MWNNQNIHIVMYKIIKYSWLAKRYGHLYTFIFFSLRSIKSTFILLHRLSLGSIKSNIWKFHCLDLIGTNQYMGNYPIVSNTSIVIAIFIYFFIFFASASFLSMKTHIDTLLAWSCLSVCQKLSKCFQRFRRYIVCPFLLIDHWRTDRRTGRLTRW